MTTTTSGGKLSCAHHHLKLKMRGEGGGEGGGDIRRTADVVLPVQCDDIIYACKFSNQHKE